MRRRRVEAQVGRLDGAAVPDQQDVLPMVLVRVDELLHGLVHCGWRAAAGAYRCE